MAFGKFWQGAILGLVFIMSAQASAYSATPIANTSWHVQLDGALNLPPDVQLYDIDLFDTPASTIANLRAQGKTVICYFSAGTYENWRPDANAFPTAARGKNVDGWKGEQWLDINNPQIMAIMNARLDLAQQKGCSGVDPDNVDGFTQKSGFTITRAQQVSFLTALSTQAHARGLSIGLKNAMDIILDVGHLYDFAINESCLKYKECGTYALFVATGKPVFAIDYSGYSKAKCAKAAAAGINVQFYKKNLKGLPKLCPKT